MPDIDSGKENSRRSRPERCCERPKTYAISRAIYSNYKGVRPISAKEAHRSPRRAPFAIGYWAAVALVDGRKFLPARRGTIKIGDGQLTAATVWFSAVVDRTLISLVRETDFGRG